ncbi:MAG: hypothetical protein AAF438_05790 [Pseudomonadota bacterium]
MLKKIIGYIMGLVGAYVLAVFLVSQFNIARVTELGYSVSLSQRIETAAHDLVSMLGLYFPLVAGALLVAFLFTGLILTRFIPRSPGLYALAGFAGLVLLHVILNSVLGLVGVAPTRTLLGLGAQGLAGAFGGWLFYQFAFLADPPPC